ncbi:MAG: MoaD/ThiS family protein [Pseudomonadota bacterium]
MSRPPRILYFGKLTDVTGHTEETEQLPDTITDTNALRQWADGLHGNTGALLEATIRIAIDSEIVPEPSSLSGATEIAFMPPVGGG